MKDDKQEEFTEDDIKRYLDAEVYLRRGMTREAYIQLCKDKWDGFRDVAPNEKKVIIDFLMPPLLDDHIGPMESFDYFESYENAEYKADGNAEVECFAKRDVVFQLEVGKGFKGLTIREDLTDEIKTPDFFEIDETLNEGVFIVALFDILGFSKLVEKVGSKGVIEVYQKLINLTLLSKSYKSYERIKIAPNKFVMSTVYVPIKHAYFSDTIILWTKIESENFYALSPFVAKCADLICEALNLGIPLRGSLSCGVGIMHKATNTYIGNPLSEANELEKNQKWIGASFGNSFHMTELLEALNEKIIVPAFCTHYKHNLGDAIPYLTVDWISRWKSKGYPDLEKILKKMMASAPDKNKEYYQNTIDFIDFARTRDNTKKAQFLRSKFYRVTDVMKFDSQDCHMATAIIRAKNGQFFNGAIIGFSPEIWPQSLNELFDNNIVFIRLADVENVMDYYKERANERLSINQQFFRHRAVNKADIMYIDIVAYDAVEVPKRKQRKRRKRIS